MRADGMAAHQELAPAEIKTGERRDIYDKKHLKIASCVRGEGMGGGQKALIVRGALETNIGI